MEVELDEKPRVRFRRFMKVTLEIPADLYRRVEAKSALEGRPVKEVANELFRTYVEEPATDAATSTRLRLVDGEPAPSWFGVFGEAAKRVSGHDLDLIRQSIAAGVAEERLP